MAGPQTRPGPARRHPRSRTTLGETKSGPIRHVFVLAGAAPRTEWLEDSFVLDNRGFIVTGPDLPVSISPQEGFLHEEAEVDTLGVDQPETKCKFK